MSTILLTPDHIGSDHCVVEHILPHKSYVDINHRKLFKSDDNKFIFGTVGLFRPELLSSADTFEYVRTLISDVIDRAQKDDDTFLYINNRVIIEKFREVFNDNNRVLLITKEHRLIARYRGESRGVIQVQTCGDFCGIGVSGAIGVGLLNGGVSIFDAWNIINKFDSLTSSEHTIYSLNDLDDWG